MSKILMVEDNELNMRLFSDLLKSKGHQVFQCNEGKEALPQAKKLKPDLILMDIQMPDVNGYEATKKIRSLNKWASKIPIIGMTGSSFKEDRISMVESGMNNLLPKPVQIDHLLEILAKYMKK